MSRLHFSHDAVTEQRLDRMAQQMARVLNELAADLRDRVECRRCIAFASEGRWNDEIISLLLVEAMHVARSLREHEIERRVGRAVL